MNELLVLIPAYNEELNIVDVISSLRANAPACDILVVDDGSTDGTYERCRNMGVRIARHRVNLGLAEAVRTGMKYALSQGYRYVLQFDGDGQHDATAIGRMLDTAGESDITIGARTTGDSRGSFVRTIGRRLISFSIRITCGTGIEDPTSGMRMYNRRVMEMFVSSGHCSPEPDTLAYLIRKGVKVTEIPVHMSERRNGRSYLDFVESIRYIFRMVTSILILQWLR